MKATVVLGFGFGSPPPLLDIHAPLPFPSPTPFRTTRTTRARTQAKTKAGTKVRVHMQRRHGVDEYTRNQYN